MTNYTKKFFSEPLSFMQKYAIAPPNDVAGDRGSTGTDIDTTGFASHLNTNAAGSVPKSVRYARMMRDHKVAYAKLWKDRQMGGKSGAEQEGIGVLRFDADYADDGSRKPIWFLPWDASTAIVRLTIPPKGTTAEDPDIFFTAAINGCSVFFQGSQANPTIYHAGGNTGQSDHNEGARFWREALRKHMANSASARAKGDIVAEVNKTQYVKMPGTKGNSSTAQAEEYERMLKAKLDKAGKFTVTMVNPWGCVMGIRTGTLWTFYLQENATVICSIVTKQGVQTRYYARPMSIRTIFPGSSAIASMRMKVPVKVT
ncbi:hypothetical protein [Variovorax sp. KK3]|uniref:hypothetical protein n=1 Tax=Variovorax sp. KK3 TaxID=1855728 RepID=UPI00097C2581|nr:hypothetical protein [Variovorax sp. KK3]